MTPTISMTLEDTQNLFLQLLRTSLPSCARYTDKALSEKINKPGKSFLEDSTNIVFDFIDSGCKNELLTKLEYLALGEQVFRCLKIYMEEMSIPMTVNTLISHLHLLPFAVDRAFPSYASSGFLRSIIGANRMRSSVARAQVLVA